VSGVGKRVEVLTSFETSITYIYPYETEFAPKQQLLPTMVSDRTSKSVETSSLGQKLLHSSWWSTS